jgi:isopenicillin N synthase-like dioxygenase
MVEMVHIPSVDYEALTSDSKHSKNIELDNLDDSMSKYGFFILTNTSKALPLCIREKYMQDTVDFFSLPEDTQMQYFVPNSNGQRGLTPFGVETGADAYIADPKSFLMFGPDKNGYPSNQVISEVPTFTAVALEALRLGENMAQKMYTALATIAGVDPLIFESYARTVTNSSARAIEYSVTPEKLELLINEVGNTELKDKIGNDLNQIYRTFPHTDINLLTFVMRDKDSARREGLEMVTKEGVVPVVTNDWHDLACNLGDLFNLMTGWPSTVHQVAAGEGKRYSWPLFFHPPMGEGLPLLREDAITQYAEKFKELYHKLPEAGLGSIVRIDYDHALMLRLCEIKAISESDAKEFLQGIKTPIIHKS